MPRRFGVICDDLRAAPLLRALHAAAPPIDLCAVRVNAAADELFHGLSGVECRDQWEDLLNDASITDVLIGGATDAALAAARHLAQAGKTVWVLPHPDQGLMFAYEVALQLEEGQGIIAPVFPDRARNGWQQLLAASAARLTEAVEYVQWERFLPAANGASTLTAAAANARLLWDLDLLRQFSGRHNRVTTLRTGGDGGQIRQQTVTLTGDNVPEAVWTIKPATENDCDLFEAFIDDDAWALADFDGKTQWNESPPESVLYLPVRSELDVLFPADVTATAWGDAVAAFELLDAVEHSLERRRTVDLHHEPVSERTIFKTQMTAIGCAVLLGTPVLMLMYLLVASVVPLGGPLLIALRTLVFAPLFVFLLAQLLLPLTRSARRSER